MKHASDREIIREILNGNQELFRILVDRYKNPVAAVIKGMLGDCPEAEDIGQDTFISLFRTLANFRGESALKTYLIRIAMNLSLNELKRRKRMLAKNVKMDSPENYVQLFEKPQQENRELAESINMALEKLDSRQRSVFILRIVEGYSTKETADILHIPLGTVLSRLSRAMSEMKILLANEN
ncbi:MAG: RNA polymerase sigma factor [Spirochaetales bacterium]|nr:RNA polymerase sigma factor [Spirochaetales bacterium]